MKFVHRKLILAISECIRNFPNFHEAFEPLSSITFDCTHARIKNMMRCI